VAAQQHRPLPTHRHTARLEALSKELAAEASEGAVRFTREGGTW